TPSRYRLPRQKERRGAAGAVVVDVDDGNAGEAQTVGCGLARGRITIDVAGVNLADVTIFNRCIGQRELSGLDGHVPIILAAARLAEGNHSHARNDDRCSVLTHYVDLLARSELYPGGRRELSSRFPADSPPHLGYQWQDH